jgi:hypothetical protein
MKQQIWKFKIDPGKVMVIEMPVKSEILCVQMQNNEPHIWVLVSPESEKEERYFELYGTGHDIYSDMGMDRKYIGTFQIQNEGLVFHLFERLS